MFLINSRPALVTATCGSRIDPLPQAPLLPKLRGQFAEFPRPGYPHGLRLFTQGTCNGVRYGRPGSLSFPFSKPLDLGGRSGFKPVLAITALPGPIPLRAGNWNLLQPCVRLVQRVGKGACVAASTWAVGEY